MSDINWVMQGAGENIVLEAVQLDRANVPKRLAETLDCAKVYRDSWRLFQNPKTWDKTNSENSIK